MKARQIIGENDVTQAIKELESLGMEGRNETIEAWSSYQPLMLKAIRKIAAHQEKAGVMFEVGLITWIAFDKFPVARQKKITAEMLLEDLTTEMTITRRDFDTWLADFGQIALLRMAAEVAMAAELDEEERFETLLPYRVILRCMNRLLSGATAQP